VKALRARLTGPRGDAGVTLVELIVAMMILGIVLAVSSATFVSLANATSTARAVDEGTRQTSTGMNALAQGIRSARDVPVASSPDAPAFRAATGERLQLSTAVNFADTRAKPVLVTYSLDSSRRLREDRLEAQTSGTFWVFPASGTSTSRVLTAPLAAAGVPVFTYLDVNGTELVPASGSLTTAQLQQVAFVEVTLAVASGGAGGSTVTLVNTIGTPNLVR